MFGIISWVSITIENHDLVEIEGGDAFEAGGVHPELVGARAALVVRVDAADCAEMMLGGLGVKPVCREIVLALRNAEVRWR